MALTQDDLQAIATLFEGQLEALEARIGERFNQVDQSLDALFKFNETREHEYLAIKHQLGELEKKVA